MCFNQRGDISTQKDGPLKLVEKFTYLGSSVSSTENDINTRLAKAWTATDRLLGIWKTDLTDKIKRSFFEAAVVSILLYRSTIWALTKRMQKKLDINYTRMLRAELSPGGNTPQNSSCTATYHPSRKLSKLGHCWRSKDKHISDILLWTPSHRRAKVGRPSRIYIQQLCADTGCILEDIPEAMDDRDGWRERVREIRVRSAT